jgi:YidC/Oxa1 family membrane protein insertase
VEKRFALFLVLSSLILMTHLIIQQQFFPPENAGIQQPDGQPPNDQGDPGPDVAKVPAPDAPDDAPPPVADEPELVAGPEPEAAPALATLGSLAPDSPYTLLVTLNNRGAAIERIELNERTRSGQFRYRDSDRTSGYLGHLQLEDEPSGGSRVRIVGPGTPAAVATALTPGTPPGLQAGDLIVQLDSRPIRSSLDCAEHLAGLRAGQAVRIEVSRATQEAQTSRLVFEATLTDEPLSVVQPEVNRHAKTNRPDALSFLFTLTRIGQKLVERGRSEIADLPSLREGHWAMQQIEDEGAGPAVEFRRRLTSDDLKKIGIDGDLEIVKRYRLARSINGSPSPTALPAHHLTLEIEIHNLGSSAQQLAYQLDGATGLPLEGWWYSNKTHPTKFSAVGARDVAWKTARSGHGLIGAPQIYKEAKKAEDKGIAAPIPLFPQGQQQVVHYVGGDAQYFCVVLLTDPDDEPAKATFQEGHAILAGPFGEKQSQWVKTTNTTFRLASPDRTLEPGQFYSQKFTIFAGPKVPALLQQYGLEEFIAWGWFWMIAIPLSWLLHFFESLPLVNYGLAIILLTVLVRSAMMPLSRKAAKNAQMMQELAPEMKRIAEKYKTDMEKRGIAQRELFKKHNYNPFGGCLLMFVQLPIFIGLYRALSVDIELLQAPLIPGFWWCSNLAGPDMLWYWEPYLFAFFADPGTGWLGPFFNVLPIITIVLFLVQQKMFMPPATDEQTRMQQQMMKYMMVFMGVLFFRVPSGLCVYFIASSLWGIAERKMLPPPQKPDASAAAAPKKPSGLAFFAKEKNTQAESDAKKARIKNRQKRR